MNKKMTIGAPTVQRLRDFQIGFPEGPVHNLLGRLIEAPQDYTQTDLVLGEFRKTLKECRKYPAEEKQAVCSALETVMEILRMDGSDGMLENWLHGISL